MPPKPNSYWRRYNFVYKNYSKKKLFKFLKKRCKALGLPYKKKDKRGRKSKFSSITYTTYICLQKIFRNRYRDLELESTLYLPDKADHSTFARNYHKVGEEYIEKLVLSLVNKEFIFWIADSTHMSSKIKVERTRQGLRNKILLRDKYHVLCGYDPPINCVQIIGVKATDNRTSDSRGAINIMKNMESKAYFLGDSAYNTYELHEVIRKVGLYPLIKPDKKGIRKGLSIKAANVRLF